MPSELEDYTQKLKNSFNTFPAPPPAKRSFHSPNNKSTTPGMDFDDYGNQTPSPSGTRRASPPDVQRVTHAASPSNNASDDDDDTGSNSTTSTLATPGQARSGTPGFAVSNEDEEAEGGERLEGL